MPYHDDDDYISATSRPYARRTNGAANNNTDERAIEAKLVVMGNTGVGKTSLVTRYTEDRFSARTTATTGALFVSHKTEMNGLQVRLQIWDTAGEFVIIFSLQLIAPLLSTIAPFSVVFVVLVAHGLSRVNGGMDQSPPCRADSNIVTRRLKAVVVPFGNGNLSENLVSHQVWMATPSYWRKAFLLGI